MFRSIKLKNISTLIGSGVTPLRSNQNFWSNGIIPWLKTEQLGEFEIYETSEKISQQAIDETSIKIFPTNTISIAMYGEGKTRGNVSILKREMTTNQACCNIVLDSKKANYYYVYYYLKTQYYQLRNLSSGVRKNLNSNDIKEFEIRIPDSLSIQENIASILYSIDSKIELNNRINTELEAMAKTLYDYWFVQFDFPDKNGKPYKTNGGKMVWNEELKRDIPEGWEVNKISKKVTIGSGFPFNSEDYNKVGTYKVITIKNVQDGFLDTSSVDYVSLLPMKISEFCILKVGDILMSLTGNVGRMCFVDQNNLLLNQRVGKLIGEKDFVVYSYFFFKRPENQQRLSKIANGSSQANLSPIEAVKDNFAIPSKKKMDLFSEFVHPMIDQILSKNRENQKLTELRDWLLPMLMNGQVKVN